MNPVLRIIQSGILHIESPVTLPCEEEGEHPKTIKTSSMEMNRETLEKISETVYKKDSKKESGAGKGGRSIS
jgi:hypothetical protein